MLIDDDEWRPNNRKGPLHCLALGGSISSEVESQPTLNAKIALDMKENIKER